ncbi:MAG: DUF1800 family protein [Betaproteobacteria bacterium]|nr:DUF1800 family protein [Betaproteobacteria bacterium]
MKLKLSWLCTSMALFLAGCGGQDVAGTANLSGQVGGLSTPSSVTHYAAARFLEQASMGPSPSMMEQVKAQGIDAWITAQMKLPPTKIITPESMVNYDDQRDKPAADRMRDFYNLNLFNFFIGGEDQLRIRTTWALSNFLVVSTRKVAEYGGLEYLNTLQSGALGQYSDLLKNITLSPAMGNYLDNSQNTKWQLNENYGRELMQLFSVGLVQLNMDGTPKRDANGKVIETRVTGGHALNQAQRHKWRGIGMSHQNLNQTVEVLGSGLSCRNGFPQKRFAASIVTPRIFNHGFAVVGKISITDEVGGVWDKVPSR